MTSWIVTFVSGFIYLGILHYQIFWLRQRMYRQFDELMKQLRFVSGNTGIRPNLMCIVCLKRSSGGIEIIKVEPIEQKADA